MPKQRKSDYDWWKQRIELLTSIKIEGKGISLTTDELYNSISNTGTNLNFYEKGVWTAKKLAILQYYLDIYTKILRPRCKRLFYFDLFSGSGLVKLEGFNKYIYGSALLSTLIPSYPRCLFDKYYFIEINKEYVKTLEKLVNEINQRLDNCINYEIIQDDMNKVNYSKYMTECEHSLVVVDPEGLEPKWATVSEILEHNCDIIFTFMTSGIQRSLGKKDEGTRKTIIEFVGEEGKRIYDILDAEELMKLYTEKIKSKGKDATVNIPVNAKHFKYNIIVAARKTFGGNPWLRAIEEIKKRIGINDEVLENIFNIVFGKQKELPLED
ncbi:MAG: three-Cys-motif partner protein TcmP [Nitrososphaeria archaeon]